MNRTDKLVNAWVRDKFLESWQYQKNVDHYGPSQDIRVLSADVEWYCLCYSEYTRDDGYEMKATLANKAGQFAFSFGLWGNLPDFIEELDSYRESQEEQTCPYDDPDDWYE